MFCALHYFDNNKLLFSTTIVTGGFSKTLI